MNGIKTWMLVTLLFMGLFAQTQTISVNFKNASVYEVLDNIARQTGYSFMVPSGDTIRVTIQAKHISVNDLLRTFCEITSYSFIVSNGTIMMHSAPRTQKVFHKDVAAKVVNEYDEPVGFVSVSANSTGIGITDSNGIILIPYKYQGNTICFTSIGYEPVRIVYDHSTAFSVVLRRSIKDLDSASINVVYNDGYRRSCATSSHIIDNELFSRRVNSSVEELLSQVPGGYLITQRNGMPGSKFSIQLRGLNSIGIRPGRLPVDEPFILVDGIPFSGNTMSLMPSVVGEAPAQQATSPLAAINPEDIESIDVLKDAEATALYGSRGANGVILIRTKKGEVGKPRLGVKYYSGIGRIINIPGMMNTQQYVQMRKEALYNDHIDIDSKSAPDLTMWDTTRYTDFKKMLIGGRATVSNAQVTISGGKPQWQYLFSTGFYNETTVFPANLGFRRFSLLSHVTYQSTNKNLKADLVYMATANKNNSFVEDITKGIYTVPHAPDLYDAEGRLVWQEGDVSFNNPLALLLRRRSTNAFNSLYNVQVEYKFSKTLKLKLNVGGNTYYTNDLSRLPAASHDPYLNPTAKDSTSNYRSYFSNWIVEPHLAYSRKSDNGVFTGLLGSTLMGYVNKEQSMLTTQTVNDTLLKTTRGNVNRYAYKSTFARLSYRYKAKYFINVTTRLDGSSRFAPTNRLGFFNAVSVAWIFSNEPFFKKNNYPINFGKIRTSYGTVGNDQIGESSYVNTQQSFANNNQGSIGFLSVDNLQRNYSWQVSRKFEAAIELGILEDKLFLSLAWYRNRTGNQVIANHPTAQTGYSKIEIRNSSAIVQNTGWELWMQAKTGPEHIFEWSNNLSLTIPKNKLLRFPALENTAYANSLVVGQPLSVQQGYRLMGINPTTGLYEFADLNKDGKISYPEDFGVIGNLDPTFYSIWQSSLTYKNWILDIYMEGRVQKALGYLYQLYNNDPPGNIMANQPVELLDRWRQPGDQSAIQQLTTNTSTPAAGAMQYFLNSDGRLTNASYIRLKSLVLSYNLDKRLIKKIRAKNFRIFMAGNNLFTITRYQGTDPETRNIYTLPPLKMLIAGFQCSF